VTTSRQQIKAACIAGGGQKAKLWRRYRALIISGLTAEKATLKAPQKKKKNSLVKRGNGRDDARAAASLAAANRTRTRPSRTRRRDVTPHHSGNLRSLLDPPRVADRVLKR